MSSPRTKPSCRPERAPCRSHRSRHSCILGKCFLGATALTFRASRVYERGDGTARLAFPAAKTGKPAPRRPMGRSAPRLDSFCSRARTCPAAGGTAGRADARGNHRGHQRRDRPRPRLDICCGTGDRRLPDRSIHFAGNLIGLHQRLAVVCGRRPGNACGVEFPRLVYQPLQGPPGNDCGLGLRAGRRDCHGADGRCILGRMRGSSPSCSICA